MIPIYFIVTIATTAMDANNNDPVSKAIGLPGECLGDRMEQIQLQFVLAESIKTAALDERKTTSSDSPEDRIHSAKRRKKHTKKEISSLFEDPFHTIETKLTPDKPIFSPLFKKYGIPYQDELEDSRLARPYLFSSEGVSPQPTFLSSTLAYGLDPKQSNGLGKNNNTRDTPCDRTEATVSVLNACTERLVDQVGPSKLTSENVSV